MWLPGDPPLTDARAEATRQEFIAQIASPGFACVMGRSVMNKHRYGFATLPAFEASATPALVVETLAQWAQARKRWGRQFASMVIAFAGPMGLDAEQYERALWQLLSRVHEADPESWDPKHSSDPAHPNFSFSIAGCAYFIVAMHAHNPRLDRITSSPIGVFNASWMFDDLTASGHYPRVVEIIRARELARHARAMPGVPSGDAASEAPQYAGIIHDEPWKCPFSGPCAVSGGHSGSVGSGRRG